MASICVKEACGENPQAGARLDRSLCAGGPACGANARQRLAKLLPPSFRRRFRRRPDGVLLRLYVIRCLMHYHLLALSRQLEREDASPINTY